MACKAIDADAPPAAMSAQPEISADLLTRLAAIAGARGLVTDPGAMAPYLTDWRGLYQGRAAAIVRPASTGEVAAIVRLCAETRTPIVPQGGNTGMCGAATPDTSGNAIVLSLARMNKIIELDPLNNTMTVEAGCILANIQQAALTADRFFPLSLGAEGSCQIGGNLATNAGGINVLRYGNTRDLVLGLEVVVADGSIWSGLRGLRKDNTGYDLKHLFIGAEGTLGIITKAVLKLFPRPRSSVTALAAMHSAEAAVELLALLRNHCGDRISAFEIMSRNCLDMVFRHIPDTRDPLPEVQPWYILADLSDTREGSAIREEFERAIEEGIAHGLVSNAVVAGSQSQAQTLWQLRESIPEAARVEGLVYRHDIAVAVSRIPEFIATASCALEARFPAVRIICFGHLGDGNLHFNAFVPGRERADAQARAATDVNRIVHDIVQQFGGSISAEHGIGQAKRGELKRYKSEVELDLMRALKKTLDPHNLMNPGKVL
ncbi:MAG: FAD-binding oxidoreductase [Betaproteobacteria bacterium]|nr:FAD-binding oxidoreductase [Betaproteobacteria bacterium]